MIRDYTTVEYISLEEQLGANTYKPLNIVLEKGQGVWLFDVEGKRYLDCLSAYSSNNMGHCHPKLLQALKNQAEKLTQVSRAFRTSQLPKFFQEITALTGKNCVLPMNTGVEAVETAIKLSRKWGYTVKGIEENKAEIIVCENNFHGRTVTAISFSSEQTYKNHFGPFTPGFKIIPYGCVLSLKNAITKNTCAFLVEPMQGEGGIVIPEDGYLKGVQDICRENNILLMADEIQTGFGRTGKLFACEHENVDPDILIVGKSLSGGFYPVSAVLADRKIMDVLKPGDHGSTFSGNPLGCAVAREAMKVLQEENLIEKSAELGKYLLKNLKNLKYKHIKQVRGKGLFIGIELDMPARPYCESLLYEGILCKETRTYVIRITPPLIITEEQIDMLFDCLVKVFDKHS